MVICPLLQRLAKIPSILEKHTASILRVNESGTGGFSNNWKKCAGSIRNLEGILTNQSCGAEKSVGILIKSNLTQSNSFAGSPGK
jgi:hypothetical protein